MLDVERLYTNYGKISILRDVSLSVGAGEVVALLGLNGAGKTTTLRSILGLTPARSGSIRFDGAEIVKESPYKIARMGVGYVPPVIIYNPVFAYETGDEFMRAFRDASVGRLDPFILVLEGSVPNEEINGDGHWASRRGPG